ncbi:hypothetical protein C5167_042701, partial [Papaver somniferum]
GSFGSPFGGVAVFKGANPWIEVDGRVNSKNALQVYALKDTCKSAPTTGAVKKLHKYRSCCSNSELVAPNSIQVVYICCLMVKVEHPDQAKFEQLSKEIAESAAAFSISSPTHITRLLGVDDFIHSHTSSPESITFHERGEENEALITHFTFKHKVDSTVIGLHNELSSPVSVTTLLGKVMEKIIQQAGHKQTEIHLREPMSGLTIVVDGSLISQTKETAGWLHDHVVPDGSRERLV